MTSTSERRSSRAPRRTIWVGESEIRLISANDLAIAAGNRDCDRDSDKDQRIFVPGGRYDPEKFPETEKFLKEWRRTHS
jgi:hypothetical protein